MGGTADAAVAAAAVVEPLQTSDLAVVSALESSLDRLVEA